MKQFRFNLLMIFAVLSLSSCGSSGSRNGADNRDRNGQIPVLSPEESMNTMQIEEGFQVKLVASEPLISTPVAMTFDDSGRIWLVEMTDYDPIRKEGTAEYPLGNIVILTDTNMDGQMDEKKVFLDSLVMPRALCLVDSGLLVASPPNLWYVKIRQDRPGKKILIDSAYTVSMNPEGQTNGLLRGIDNWIYSAGFGSNKRYRKIKGKWHIEETFLRGQWGLTQDQYGHLFYNNNSQNLLGDYFLPGVTGENKNQKRVAGFNEKIIPDNRVYPMVPTPGVNRGYREGVLDSTKRLIHFTAACGPLIYRGGIFPDDYSGNAFVCEPAAYLIKRNILSEDGLKITGKQAYEEKEFLASTDRRFRPVNLNNSPEGALYVVDMYRGVIQDDLSLTDYLKKYSLEHGLDKPVNCGRIYRIFPENSKLLAVKIPEDPFKAVELLKSKNGWVRDNAQQKLVDDNNIQVVPTLRNLLYNNESSVVTKIHVLWTLEGLAALRQKDIVSLLNSNNRHLKIQALTALISILYKNNYRTYLPTLKQLISKKDSIIISYVTYVVGKIYAYSPETANRLWIKILRTYPDNIYVVDAIISAIKGKEKQYVNRFKYSSLFHQQLKKLLKRKKKLKKTKNLSLLKKKYPKGYAVYKGTCQTCHGSDGNGIEFVAPPLNESNWVRGDKNKLIPIVLYGLSGPIKVNDKLYKKPEVTGQMPGFGNNKFSDSAIAEVLSFIRQAWNNNAADIKMRDIKAARMRYKGRTQSFTMEELNALDE